MIHKDLKYKRRNDLEDKGLATVWIQVSQKGTKPLLVQSVYRQLQRIGKPGSGTPARQAQRWTKILDKWVQAASEDKELITLGDLNVNQFAWDLHPTQMTLREKSQDNLVKELKDRILSQGFTVINKSPTRNVASTTEKEACLDYIVTNKLDMVINHDSIYPIFSDHSLLKLTRRQKVFKSPRQLLKTRSLKNLDIHKYKQDILNHPLYLDSLYNGDLNQVSENIQTIIQNSLDIQAPVKTILLSPKNKSQISTEAKELLSLRDISHQDFKTSGNVDDNRQMRNYRNQANKLIAREHFLQKVKNLQDKGISSKERWKRLKTETGQNKFKSPKVIIEGQVHHVSPKAMANSLNRQFISKISKVIGDMPPQATNPLNNYQKFIGRNDLHFKFKQINMSTLRSVLSKLKSTNSSSQDEISMRSLKMARREIEPLLLHLINLIITRADYPAGLKVSKVIPIRKEPNDERTPDGWRPINIGSSLSKVAERVLLTQIIEHLDRNSLISHAHHGSVARKSTQTIISEIYDNIMEDIENDTDIALLILDQSKAYDLVDHQILIQKFKALGFDPKSLSLLEGFLRDRKQFVHLQGFDSDTLLVGNRSVTQGSTLSCIMYLVYILDMPAIFHDMNHDPEEALLCTKEDLKTFVDDNLIRVKKNDHNDLEHAIHSTMEKMESYMSSNKLRLNSDKTKVIVFSKKKETRDNFSIRFGDKTIRHSPQVKLLGNVITDTLTWDHHVEKIVLPGLRNRIRTLRMTSRYLDPSFKISYTNCVYRSKLLFAIESWGGSSKVLLNKIQSLQDQASKLALGANHSRLSANQRQAKLGWLSVERQIQYSTHQMTWKILNLGIPEQLAVKMKINETGHRIQTQRKLAKKPRWLNKNLLVSRSFRSRSYNYNTLPGRITSITSQSKFKKSLRVLLLGRNS